MLMAQLVTESPLIVSLGEAMIRLSPRRPTPLEHGTDFEVHVAGSELNLLITAVALGARSRWLTRLPRNKLGEMISRHALSNNVEVVATEEDGGRAGLFFFELGVPPRPSSVIYDRKDSAASHLTSDEFEWDVVISDAAAAHVSGITCSLGTGPFAATLAFLESANRLGVMTSFDMNHRSQLWSIDEARTAYRMVLPLVDTLFVSPHDLVSMCEKTGETETLAEHLVDEFGISTMVVRERHEVSSEKLDVTVQVFGESHSEATASGHVVDELGAGDAAAGAFLTSMLMGDAPSVSSERCARAYARMLTIPGDAWVGSIRDLNDGYLETRKVMR
jgi:2-dehydro-3-deoxygluconokinase